jgi:hypothetical protein
MARRRSANRKLIPFWSKSSRQSPTALPERWYRFPNSDLSWCNELRQCIGDTQDAVDE